MDTDSRPRTDTRFQRIKINWMLLASFGFPQSFTLGRRFWLMKISTQRRKRHGPQLTPPLRIFSSTTPSGRHFWRTSLHSEEGTEVYSSTKRNWHASWTLICRIYATFPVNTRSDSRILCHSRVNKSQYWPLDAPRGGFSTCGTDGRTDGRTVKIQFSAQVGAHIRSRTHL